MDLLKRRIRNEAKAIGTNIVNVDSFLDHQLDIGLFMAIGKEIKSRFAHMGINKILTVEASGVAIAAITATYFDLVPVVFAKKTQPDNITEACYSTEINKEGIICAMQVAKQYLNEDDRVLILDDFLAHGETTLGLCSLVEQAGGTVCAVTAVVEKEFQGGSTKLREAGYHVDSLAVITSIEDGKMIFKD